MLREVLKEHAPKLRSSVKAALGGLALGYLMRGSKSRLQLAQAETAKQAAEAENEQLRHEIAHDDLTGLLTKKALIKRGNERLSHTGTNRIYALVFFDLDNFKTINDKHPDKYDEGDRTLRRSAQVLLSNIRTRGTSADILAHGKREDGDGEAARLGGDEFAGLFEITARNEKGEAMSEEERLTALCDRIRADFKTAFADRPDLQVLGGVDLSMGAVIRQPGEMMESMLSRGAVLMGEEKKEHHAQNGAYRF